MKRSTKARKKKTFLFCKRNFVKKVKCFFEVKTIPEKRKPSFWRPYLVWLFFGKPFEEKTRRSKKSKQRYYSLLTHKYLGETRARAIFLLRKFGETKNLYGNLKEWIQLEREVARYICLKILGLRLELEKAVKCLYNTNIWNLLWAPFIRSKICLCFSDVFIAILANSNSQNIAMKQGPLHGVSTPHNTLKQSLRYHIACLFSRFSHYPFLELAVEILRFTEYSW